MSRLPRRTGKEVLGSFLRHGFKIVRQRGSHVFVQHPDGRCTTIPIHAGEVLGPGLLSKIRRDLKMTSEQLEHLLE